jgi:hydroxymethylglutaryl-CoA synthase
LGLVGSDLIKYGMAIGADTSQGAPGDALEYTASAGGAAYILGKENVIAKINKTYSFTTDTPDFWRREGEKYPSHGGRFTGEPAYFKHILTCAKNLMDKVGTKHSDYNYAVFHQPNGKFPVSAARKLGFSKEQIKEGLLTPVIGNTYSGAVLIGLAAILDIAKPGDRIFMVAYGSGAGSDSFDITVTDAIQNINRSGEQTVQTLISNHKFLTYATYAKYMGKIHLRGA